jgi:hypothetical protein
LVNINDFLIFYLLFRLFIKRENTKAILACMAASLALPFIVSWFQYFNKLIIIPGVSDIYFGENMYFPNCDLFVKECGWRIGGFFGQSHILTVWLGIMAPLLFLIKRKFRYLAIVFYMFSIMVFKHTLGGFFVGLTSIAVTQLSILRSKKLFLTSLFITGIIGAIILLINDSAHHHFLIRIGILKEVLPFIKEHPLIGNGVNSFGGLGIKKLAQLHNDYVQFYVEYGAYALMAIPFVVTYIKKFLSITYSLHGRILFGIFSGFLVASAFSFPFHTAHSALIFLTVIALCDTFTDRKRLEAN